MKKYICKTHNTKMIIDKEGNREINIRYNAIGCHLPRVQDLREMKLGNCEIREVEEENA